MVPFMWKPVISDDIFIGIDFSAKGGKDVLELFNPHFFPEQDQVAPVRKKVEQRSVIQFELDILF